MAVNQSGLIYKLKYSTEVCICEVSDFHFWYKNRNSIHSTLWKM